MRRPSLPTALLVLLFAVPGVARAETPEIVLPNGATALDLLKLVIPDVHETPEGDYVGSEIAEVRKLDGLVWNLFEPDPDAGVRVGAFSCFEMRAEGRRRIVLAIEVGSDGPTGQPLAALFSFDRGAPELLDLVDLTNEMHSDLGGPVFDIGNGSDAFEVQGWHDNSSESYDSRAVVAVVGDRFRVVIDGPSVMGYWQHDDRTSRACKTVFDPKRRVLATTHFGYRDVEIDVTETKTCHADDEANPDWDEGVVRRVRHRAVWRWNPRRLAYEPPGGLPPPKFPYRDSPLDDVVATFGPPPPPARRTRARTVAYAVDARTGATVASAAVGMDPTNGIVFSPDGSRFVACETLANGPSRAVEYRTSDLRPLRSVTARGTAGRAVDVVGAFYGGPDRSLHAVVRDGFADAGPWLSVARVREPGTEPVPARLAVRGDALTISADGRVGFVVTDAAYDADGRATSATVESIDLRTLLSRGTISLEGDRAAAFRGVEPSADGSALYLLGDVGSVRALDARTGEETRRIPTGWSGDPSLGLANVCSGGRALLLSASGDACEVDVPDGAYWASDGVLSGAPVTIARAVDTGRARFGADREGRLFALGADARAVPLGRLRLPRVASDDEATVVALAASPDGSRLLVVVAVGEIVCPC